jgi:peroxiredoxin
METSEFKSLMIKMDGRIGLNAPAKAFALKDIKNKNVSLSILKGKVVLLDFWATWCPPCREEIPNLKAYYAEFKNQGFEIVGISLDKDREALDKYLAEQGINWLITFSGLEWKDETATLYGVNSIPSTWLIDRQGVLRHFDLRGESLKAAIVALLGE